MALYFFERSYMTKVVQEIITIGAIGTAILTIYGIVKSVVKFIASAKERELLQRQRNESQDIAIARLKEENQLICYGLSAALDGLEQLGANHIVPVAKGKLEKYLNQQAHQ